MSCCANPQTEPNLQDIVDAVGASTALRMEHRVFLPVPIEEATEASDLRRQFSRAVTELDYRIPS